MKKASSKFPLSVMKKFTNYADARKFITVINRHMINNLIGIVEYQLKETETLFNKACEGEKIHLMRKKKRLRKN